MVLVRKSVTSRYANRKFPLPGVVGLRVAGGGIVRRLPAKMHETRDSLANDVIGRYISTLGPQTTPARLSNALVVPAA